MFPLSDRVQAASLSLREPSKNRLLLPLSSDVTFEATNVQKRQQLEVTNSLCYTLRFQSDQQKVHSEEHSKRGDNFSPVKHL